MRSLGELQNTQLYSEELGIDLRANTDRELFQWFLASTLFGARISETIAQNTYRAFERHGLLDSQKILDAGLAFLVNPVMREGGYVRYDGRASSQILTDCEKLLNDYDGSLLALHGRAKDSRDLEERLLDFYGVGPVTVNIFLRELRPIWPKSNPAPLPAVKKAAASFGIDLGALNRKSIAFCRVEAGLIRARRQATRCT